MLRDCWILSDTWNITTTALPCEHRQYSGVTLSISNMVTRICGHISEPLGPREFVLDPAGRGKELWKWAQRVKSKIGYSGVVDKSDLAFTAVRTSFEDWELLGRDGTTCPCWAKVSLPTGWPATYQVCPWMNQETLTKPECRKIMCKRWNQGRGNLETLSSQHLESESPLQVEYSEEW